MNIRILLADDHKFVRDSLRLLLPRSDGYDIVAEADNGAQALRLARETAPDVVVMDIRMPDVDGIAATRRILSERPQTRIIGISMDTRKQFVEAMFAAGAMAYLLKDSAVEELKPAIHAVVAGQSYLSKDLAQHLTPSPPPDPDVDPALLMPFPDIGAGAQFDEQLCYDLLLKALHPGGLRCPDYHALPPNQAPHNQTRAPVLDYKCRTCGKVFNLFTGTLWSGARYSCSQILRIMRGILNRTPVAQLARELDIDRAHLARRRKAIHDLARICLHNLSVVRHMPK